MSDSDNISTLDLAASGIAASAGDTKTNKSGTGSGKGARFNWTDTTDKIVLLAMIQQAGIEGYTAASKALESQGFLNSEGKAVNPSAIHQHFSKVRTAIGLLRGDDDSANTAGTSSVSPLTPKKRGRPSTKTPEQKAAAAAESARKKAEKAAEKAAGVTPSKRGPGRPKKSAVKIEVEEVAADDDDGEGERAGDGDGDDEGDKGSEDMDLDDSDAPMTKRRKAEAKGRHRSSTMVIASDNIDDADTN